MQRLRFINARGAEISFDNHAPFVFWKIQGIEMPPTFSISTQASGQHGYTPHELLLEQRTVRLSAHIHGTDGVRRMYELRKSLNEVCNPLLGIGTLVYENDNGIWQIGAFCRGNPYAGKTHGVQTLDLTFECPLPFWLSRELSEAKLAYVDGGLEFPIITPNNFGTLGYQVHIDNDGDAPAPLEFFIDGGALNPIIINETTGEFIRLSRHVRLRDTLYINTDPEALEVSLITIDPETNLPQRDNAYGYISVDSTLFRLVPGINMLKFTSDDENKQVRIRILFRKRYVGV